MKTLESAVIDSSTLDDGRRVLTICHDVLRGVTPAMLGWWFRNIEGTMEHMGATYPRYLVWHPVDHIHYAVSRPAPDGSAGPGARFHLVEAFGADPDHVMELQAEVVRNDEAGIALVARRLGLPVVQLQHTFTAVTGGTLYRTRLQVGTTAPIARGPLNRAVLPLAFGEDVARAWLKHNVEEVGNLEHFLPKLCARGG